MYHIILIIRGLLGFFQTTAAAAGGHAVVSLCSPGSILSVVHESSMGGSHDVPNRLLKRVRETKRGCQICPVTVLGRRSAYLYSTRCY